MTCRILVPQPGIEPMPLAGEALSPNHWTARKFPRCSLLRVQFNVLCGQRRDIIGLLVSVELAKELLIIDNPPIGNLDVDIYTGD